MVDFLYLRSIKVNFSWCYCCESGKQRAVKGLARPSPGQGAQPYSTSLKIIVIIIIIIIIINIIIIIVIISIIIILIIVHVFLVYPHSG